LQVIVLEHVGEPLRSLSQYIERRADIEHAINQIHKLAVRHGDLRPPNVLIDSNGRVRIIDFGMATKDDGDIWEELNLKDLPE
jgi:eukaryotic-like serine/threonine-protein kinase